MESKKSIKRKPNTIYTCPACNSTFKKIGKGYTCPTCKTRLEHKVTTVHKGKTSRQSKYYVIRDGNQYSDIAKRMRMEGAREINNTEAEWKNVSSNTEDFITYRSTKEEDLYLLHFVSLIPTGQWLNCPNCFHRITTIIGPGSAECNRCGTNITIKFGGIVKGVKI